jgi:hypothetical protein
MSGRITLGDFLSLCAETTVIPLSEEVLGRIRELGQWKTVAVKPVKTQYRSANNVIEERKRVDAPFRRLAPHGGEQPKPTADKLLFEIRVAVNKCSASTLEKQKKAIGTHIEGYHSIPGADVTKLHQMLIQSMTSSCLHVDMYASMFADLTALYPDLRQAVLHYYSVESFKAVAQVPYADPNKDYDGFCRFNEMNDDVKCKLLFAVALTKSSILPMTHLQALMHSYACDIRQFMEREGMVEMVDQWVDRLFLLLHAVAKASWGELVTDLVNRVASSKPKEYPSLENRSIFRLRGL